jgi:hypothetical protein
MLVLPNLDLKVAYKTLLQKHSAFIIVVPAKSHYAQCHSDKCDGTAKIVLNKKCYCILITLVDEECTFKVSFEITSLVNT